MTAYTTQVSGPIEDVVRAFEEESKQSKLALVRKTDMQTKLLERGISLGHFYWILEFIEPDLSKNILLTDLLAGLYLPGRIAIYPHKESELITISLFLPTQSLSNEMNRVSYWLRQWEGKMIELVKRVQAR
ncbi:Uncharacterized conserved protein, DUF302 family [Seinonella peptonophila]|uniref:Uncharacterized conserved protein, DUF302 family n=1 Tax=Seinonella peptonophila TaxID=112248 RepID=A0A1M4XPD1_9BACL|nr:hypothetical protein [Seinonella peptonophila]SHE95290.1 Uncharacterized conserved protein, DUF302 family [Seinonella peptonophila]